MKKSLDPDAQEALGIRMVRVIGVGFCLVAGAMALIVLVGWIVGFDALRSFNVHWATMKPGTSLCIVCLSVSTLLGLDRRPALRVFAASAAGLAALISVLSLIELAMGWDFGVIRAIARSASTDDMLRMSVATATSLGLLALARLADARDGWSTSVLGLTCAALIPALLSLAGYLYEAEALYSIPGFSSMSLPTAICCALLALGNFCVVPSKWQRLLIDEGPGGELLRRTLPWVIVVMVAVAILTTRGVAAGIVDGPMAGALALVTALLVGVVLLMRGASAVHDRHEVLRSIVDTTTDGIVSIDERGTIQSANPAALSMFEYSLDELVGRNVSMLMPRPHREQQDGHLERHHRTGEPPILGNGGEVEGLRKSGEVFPLDISIGEARIGERRLYSATLRDLSEQKRQEALHRESEDRFRLLADQAPVLVWMSGTDKKCVFFNRTWLAFTGRSMEQEVGDGWAEGVHPDDLVRCLDVYTRSFDRREQFEMEYRLRRHDGEYRWLLDRGTPLQSAEGEFVGYIGSCLDITERRQSAERERESEGMLRSVFEAAVDGMITIDERGLIIMVNSAAEKVFGYGREEMLGRNLTMLMPSPYRDEHDGYLANYGRTGQRKIIGIGREVQGLRKNGEVFPMDLAVSEALSQGRRVYTGIVRDLTERRRQEDQLRESEARFRTMAEAAPLMIWLADIHLRRTYNNPRWLALVGEGAALGGSRWMEFVHPDDRDRVLKSYSGAAAATQPVTQEFRFRNARGEYRWIFDSCVAIRDAVGHPMGLVGSSLDVTDSKEDRERQNLLMQELDHRVKNNLAAVIAVAQSTMASTDSRDTFQTAFLGRLMAMARSHTALAKGRWTGLYLEELVATVLEPLCNSQSNALRFGGDPLFLSRDVVPPLAMALHELGTNSQKHGAFSRPGGTVSLMWHVAQPDTHTATLVWQEKHDAPVSEDIREGLGLQLIRGLITSELGGTFEFGPTHSGLRFTMSFDYARREHAKAASTSGEGSNSG